MLRLAGMCLMVLSCTALGFAQSAALQHRVEGLRRLRELMVRMKGELQYTGAPLSELLAELALREEAPFSSYLEAVAAELRQRDGRTLGEIFCCHAALLEEGGLSKRDAGQFLRMAGRLGTLDLHIQVRTVELYLEELERECRFAQEESREKGKLYRCMGTMCGLFLAVLFL